MSIQKELSVIVPIFNTERYLSRCMDSLLSQSVAKEILLVDDGSTDRSYEIAKGYCEKNPCIQLLRQKNQGQSVARNRALSMARGEYVFFCDSDDFIDTESLPELYRLCKENDLDMIKTGWRTIFKDHTQLNLPPADVLELGTVLSAEKYFQETIQDWYNVIPWNGLFRRSFLQRNHLLFPEGIQFEDNTFHLKALLSERQARIMQVEMPFYNVWIRSESTTTAIPNPKKVYDQLQNIALMNEFIETAGLPKELLPQAKRAVSSLAFTMTSYYYRVDKKYRKELSSAIPKSVLREGIQYSQTAFQKYKLSAFLYCRPILNLYEYYKLKGQH